MLAEHYEGLTQIAYKYCEGNIVEAEYMMNGTVNEFFHRVQNKAIYYDAVNKQNKEKPKED